MGIQKNQSRDSSNILYKQSNKACQITPRPNQKDDRNKVYQKNKQFIGQTNFEMHILINSKWLIAIIDDS